jgi:hypothetical protein
VSGTGIAGSTQSLGKAKQRATHAHLSRDVSLSPAPPLRSRRAHLDAIIVPASRPASFLRRTVELSAVLGAFLVVLCSRQTKVEDVAKRVARTPGACSLIVQIPDGWNHTEFPTRSSADKFQDACANRSSDLSSKRNIGLLMARLLGWTKVVFVDDDITSLPMDNLARMAAKLDNHQVAGLRVLRHPDNSVVCHARRLANLAQDVFLTGAVLGVHCGDLPLSFFPDIYNEDWFFFAKEAAARDLPHVGLARQLPYDPFESPERARHEEFGDLLAEGLYALIGEEDHRVPIDDQLRGATAAYWSRFIEARHYVITETMTLLRVAVDRNGESARVSSALASLVAAEGQLDTITPELCVNFIHAWREDLADWQRFSNGVNSIDSTREAMDFLQLKTWTLAEFGVLQLTRETAPDPVTTPVSV